MEFIDKILIINLEKRNDRKTQILEEIVKMDLVQKTEIFKAIEYNPGFIGCTASHLNCIKLAKERGYKNVLIFEDDFQFIVDKNTFYKNIEQFFELKNLDWKVLMLSYNLLSQKPYNEFLGITNDCQTASAYLVNSKYYDELINNLEYGLRMLIKTREHWNFLNDQCWKTLQKDDKWFYLKERIGVQRESYSDLSGKVVNYGC